MSELRFQFFLPAWNGAMEEGEGVETAVEHPGRVVVVSVGRGETEVVRTFMITLTLFM